MSVLLRLENVGVRFGAFAALDGVDLVLAERDIVSVIGPNGAGKSTLVRVALGLCRPSTGRVHRRDGVRIGYVPQHVDIDPTLPLSVGRFIALGLARDAQPLTQLEAVGARHLADAPLHAISGGERRRVLLARALARRPQLLVLDEPAAGLDVSGQAALYDRLRGLRDALGCAILLVSHDLHLVMAATDRVVCLNHHVCCSGKPEAVSRDPAYLSLFGHGDVARAMAAYVHHHDHAHDLAGLPLGESAHTRASGRDG